MPNSSRRFAALLVVVSALTACKSKEAAPPPATTASADSAPATPLIQCAADGLWKPCNLLDRLVHAGVGAKAIETDTTRVKFLAPPGVHYQIGKNGLLIAFYFSDSVTAKKSWIALDTLRLRPKDDTTTVWPAVPSPIRSGNVVVAFFGTSNAQIERVSLALRAGLPVPAKAP